MSDSEKATTGNLASAARTNWGILEQKFAAADRKRHHWLVECRDLGDAYDAHAGVYFVECADSAAVDELTARCTDSNPYERILGIFDLLEPLDTQGGGLNRAQWLARQH